ncbi:MAG TPA: GrpB family protein [Microlunatus sp.]
MSDSPTPEFLVPPVRNDGPVRLAEPDPAWSDSYAREEERIRTALGERAVQIEHAGSTSVPGLAAKPVIDIVLVVADSADEPAYVPALESAGYRLRFREPAWHEHRFLVDAPTVQIHVFSVGSAEVERMLRFRDRLRSNSADLELYQRTKRELAGRHWAFVQDYAEAKTSVIEAIMTRAADEDH